MLIRRRISPSGSRSVHRGATRDYAARRRPRRPLVRLDAAAWFGTWVLRGAALRLPLVDPYPSGCCAVPRWQRVALDGGGVLRLAPRSGIGLVGDRLASARRRRDRVRRHQPVRRRGARPVVERSASSGWLGLCSSRSRCRSCRSSCGTGDRRARHGSRSDGWFVALASWRVAVPIARHRCWRSRSIAPTWRSAMIFVVRSRVGVPAAIGVAILKYRLYDIDLVIKKTVVYAILALVDPGVRRASRGRRRGSVWAGGERYSFLSPVCRDRRVCVPAAPRALARASPTGSSTGSERRRTRCSRSSPSRLAESYAADDVLPRMAQVLADGRRRRGVLR